MRRAPERAGSSTSRLIRIRDSDPVGSVPADVAPPASTGCGGAAFRAAALPAYREMPGDRTRAGQRGSRVFDGFADFAVEVDGVGIRGRQGGDPNAPVLLLHGHPQTHVMWHRVAPALARRRRVVVADLRGYGDSGRPGAGAGPEWGSKRRMARDAVELMERLGHPRFDVVGHDRGARVAARLAADRPERVGRAMLLDIAPTLDMYEGADRAFATAYWHWFFLIQPAPLPERLIAADPRAYVEGVLGGRHAGLAPFPPEALDAYVSALSGAAARAAGICADYRAAATVDLDHDRADREEGRLIRTPLRVLWAEHGVVGRMFDPLTLWRRVAVDVTGRPLDCGHYLPEERPDEVLSEIERFLDAPDPTAPLSRSRLEP